MVGANIPVIDLCIFKGIVIFIYMRPKGSADRLEYRRQWAAQLLDAGKGVNEVARLVQVSPSSVSRWKAMKAQAGEEGLKAKPHPGRGCQLSPQDKDQLKQLLLQGPQAAGFDSAVDLSACRAGDGPNVWGVLSSRSRGSSAAWVGFFMPVSPAPGARTGGGGHPPMALSGVAAD